MTPISSSVIQPLVQNCHYELVVIAVYHNRKGTQQMVKPTVTTASMQHFLQIDVSPEKIKGFQLGSHKLRVACAISAIIVP
jgi:hypothetical protein